MSAFYIKKTRFGLYTSILKEPLGQHFITGATFEGVLTMSRWHLKSLQDGTLDDYTRTVNSGVVWRKTMTKKTTTIGGDTWEWDETPEAKAAIAKLHQNATERLHDDIRANLN